MVTANAAIAGAYYAIPIILIYLSRRNVALVWNWFFTSFATFIFCCGTTHVLNIVVVWQPVYVLSAWVEGATAFSSVLTAGTLLALVPAIEDALKNPATFRDLLDDVNRRLTLEVEKVERGEGP